MKLLNTYELALVVGGEDLIDDAQSEVGKTINDLNQLREKAVDAIVDTLCDWTGDC